MRSFITLIISCICIVCLFQPCRAQKLSMDAVTKKIYIDNSDMPSGAIDTNTKCGVATVSDAALTTGYNSSTENNTVNKKFELGIGEPNTITYTWSAAYAACKTWTFDGGGWRLPTMREAQILNTFVQQINIILTNYGAGSGAITLQTQYWTATEANGTQAFATAITGSGFQQSFPKTNGYRVRCVRLIP